MQDKRVQAARDMTRRAHARCKAEENKNKILTERIRVLEDVISEISCCNFDNAYSPKIQEIIMKSW